MDGAAYPETGASGAVVVRTRRLILQPMSCELMRAIIAADWAAAGALLGTAFPNQWRQDGWNWLGPRVTEGEQDPSLCVWGTRWHEPLMRMGRAVVG